MSPEEIVPVVRRFLPESVFAQVDAEEQRDHNGEGASRLWVGLTLADDLDVGARQKTPTSGAAQSATATPPTDAQARLRRVMAEWRPQRDACAFELERVTGLSPVLIFLRWRGSPWVMFGPATRANVAVTARLTPAAVRLLDALVAAGIAPSRTVAVEWCIQRIAEREPELIQQLEALARERAVLKQRYGL